MSSDTKKLIPILIIVGVLMCGCVGLPLLVGIGMIGYLTVRHDHVANEAFDAAGGPDIRVPEMPGEISIPSLPPNLGADLSNSSKQDAYIKMSAAEADWQLARASYEAAQAVYEQQRNFNAAQAGRLGAQGISLPPPMPPDPSLYQAMLAAQQKYEAAKAEYDAIP